MNVRAATVTVTVTVTVTETVTAPRAHPERTDRSPSTRRPTQIPHLQPTG